MNFRIDTENDIIAHASSEAAEAVTGAERFSTEADLGKLAENWPADRLVDIWNSLPGGTQVKKFTNRKTGVTWIWNAIQRLGQPAKKARVPAQTRDVATAKGKAGDKAAAKKSAKADKKASTTRVGSKTAQVIALLERAKGSTLSEIMKATDWQAHSVRGFISGKLGKKMGVAVTSVKREDGERVYTITA